MSSVSGISPPPITNLYSNSGMDIEGLITKLIDAESQPIVLMQQQQQTLKAQQTAYTNVQSKVQDLLDSIRKLTTRDVATGTTLFDTMAGTSTDSTIATATATGSAASQTMNLEVISLPTSTRASSTVQVGSLMTSATSLSQMGLSDGTFTVFSGGVANTITVDSTKSVDDLLTKLNGINGITNAEVVDGKLVVSTDNSTNISFGAVGDTSTFLAKTGLQTSKKDTAGQFTATKTVSLIDLNQPVSDASLSNINGSNITGSFTINGVSFDTAGKSLNQIISDINNNANVKVTANFNAATNKLEFVSKTTGSTRINFADTGGNFLSTMGVLPETAQTVGQNAEFVLNGTTMYSPTTQVDENLTGITGVTLTLSKAQPGSTVQVTVGKDVDTITDTVAEVVDKYNAAISYIDQQTSANANSKGALAGENRLISLRNQIRSLFSTAVGALSGTAYDSLQQVGIKTAPVSAGSSASPALVFDGPAQTAFKAALATSPDIVKNLFIAQDLVNGTSGDDNMDGVLTQLQHLLSDKVYKDANGNDAYGALYNGGDTGSGLFYAFQSAATTRYNRLDDTIDRAQDRLDQKEALLRKQFTAMDQLIGQYQSQGSALTSLINQLNANK